jgi:hypothetical protein
MVMWSSRRAVITGLLAAMGALSLAFAAGAFGRSDHHGKRTGAPLIDESLAPSMPPPTDPTFHGVSPGGLPWVLKSGVVRLKRDGKLDLRVKGLVIPTAPFTGTPGPVMTIDASLYCGADSNTTPAGTTQLGPISRKGDARIHDVSFSVPATCLAPVILVHPNGIATMYIAVDGWRP